MSLVRWARENRMALTPRGKATRGYGGVMPVRGGIVVDFFHLRKYCDRHEDADGQGAAGLCWEKLDRAIARKGLTLRLYPTSYMASTVGGWLAHGGAGIGSYEAGWFGDNVVSARVVLADGTYGNTAGAELDLMSEAEGTTGLISRVTLRVMPMEELGVVSIGAPMRMTSKIW